MAAASKLVDLDDALGMRADAATFTAASALRRMS